MRHVINVISGDFSDRSNVVIAGATFKAANDILLLSEIQELKLISNENNLATASIKAESWELTAEMSVKAYQVIITHKNVAAKNAAGISLSTYNEHAANFRQKTAPCRICDQK